MGMLAHAFAAMIVPKRGVPATLQFWLDNEMRFDLTRDQNLFRDAAGGADFAERIPAGFREWEESDCDIRRVIGVFDYRNSYRDFEERVRKLTRGKIDSVVLMTCVEQPYEEKRYRFDWIRYTMEPYAVDEGTGFGTKMPESLELLYSLAKIDLQNISGTEQYWLEEYGRYLEIMPEVEIEGRVFVLDGALTFTRDTGVSLEEEIVKRGGIVRKAVSGKTDYLVTYPKDAGGSKVYAVLDKRETGKDIKIILASDLLEAF